MNDRTIRLFRISESFEGEPIFVSAWLVHSDRSTQTHKRFFDFVTSLGTFKKNIGILTDKEAGIIAGIDQCLDEKKLPNTLKRLGHYSRTNNIVLMPM